MENNRRSSHSCKILRIVALIGICALMLVLGCARDDSAISRPAGSAQRSEATATSEIEALLDLYEKSVNEADANLLSELWAQTDDVSFVNPLQRIQSWNGLQGFWQNVLRNTFSARKLRRKNVSIRTAGEVAWAVFDWDFVATMSDGQPYESSGWESQVYRMTDRGWRIAHIHYSVPMAPPPSSEQ